MIKISFLSLALTLSILVLVDLALLFLYLDESSTLKYERIKLRTEKLKSQNLEYALENLKNNYKTAPPAKDKILALTNRYYHILVLDMSEEPEGETIRRFFFCNYRSLRCRLENLHSTVKSKNDLFGPHDVCSRCGREAVVRIIYPNHVEEKSYAYFKNLIEDKEYKKKLKMPYIKICIVGTSVKALPRIGRIDSIKGLILFNTEFETPDN
jgi:hypothetical protein